MSLAYPTTEDLTDLPDDMLEVPLAESAPESDGAPVVESLAATQLRFLVLQDHMIIAARKVNLLVDMGLGQTDGYREAYAQYAAKAGEFAMLRDRLGL